MEHGGEKITNMTMIKMTSTFLTTHISFKLLTLSVQKTNSPTHLKILVTFIYFEVLFKNSVQLKSQGYPCYSGKNVFFIVC